ncbi:MAG: nitronate monooxygenase, partial [Trebonia sp.]
MRKLQRRPNRSSAAMSGRPVVEPRTGCPGFGTATAISFSAVLVLRIPIRYVIASVLLNQKRRRGRVLTTSLCRQLQLRVPVAQAPIGSAASPQLAAAVSDAGALGMLAATWLSQRA